MRRMQWNSIARICVGEEGQCNVMRWHAAAEFGIAVAELRFERYSTEMQWQSGT